MLMPRWVIQFLGAGTSALLAAGGVHAQQLIQLPEPKPLSQRVLRSFSFASDGPIGPGWSRPDLIARFYIHEDLSALFQRTVQLDGDVPDRSTLSWIFTGPHAGVSVELTHSKVRLLERFYDSMGL